MADNFKLGAFTMPSEQENPSEQKDWGTGALDKAEDRHNQFMSKLGSWQRFQQRNGDKLTLYNTLKEMVLSAKNDSSGPSVSDVYSRFGITSSTFPSGVSWKPSASFEKTLMLKTYGQGKLPSSVSNKFIEFGRQVAFKRESVERKALELIAVLKFGHSADMALSQKKPKELVRSTPYRSLSKSKKGSKNYNEFYEQFYNASYRQKLVIIRELFASLGSSEVGKEYICWLFQNPNEGIFNPYDVFRPPVLLGPNDDKSKLQSYGYTVQVVPPSSKGGSPEDYGMHVKGPAEYKAYFHDDGTTTNVISSDESKAMSLLFKDVFTNLLPGLAEMLVRDHLIKQAKSGEWVLKGQLSSSPQLQDAYRFMMRCAAADVTDEFVQKTAANSNLDLPSKSSVIDSALSGKSLDLKKAAKIGAVIAGQTDAFLENGLKNITLEWEGPSGRSYTEIEQTLPGRKVFAGLKMVGIGIFTVDSVMGAGESPTAKSISKAALDVLNAVKDLKSLNVYLDDISSLSFSFTSEANAFGRAVKLLNKYNPVLAFFGVCMNGWKFAIEVKEGDYDALVGAGCLLAGSVAFWAASTSFVQGATSAGFWAALTSPVGALIAVGVVLTVLGIWLYQKYNDSAMQDWLEQNYFGTQWSSVKTPDEAGNVTGVANPEGSTYKFYRKNKRLADSKTYVPHFTRQVQEFHTLTRGLGLTTVDYYENGEITYSPDGTSKGSTTYHHKGVVVLEPPSAGADVEAGGILIIRPDLTNLVWQGSYNENDFLEMHRDNVPKSKLPDKSWGDVAPHHKMYPSYDPGLNPPKDVWLTPRWAAIPRHTIYLGDSPPHHHDATRVPFPGREYMDSAPNLGLRVETTPSNPSHGDRLTKVKATIWAEKDAESEYIFGYKKGKITGGWENENALYVEVLYLPPGRAEDVAAVYPYTVNLEGISEASRAVMQIDTGTM